MSFFVLDPVGDVQWEVEVLADRLDGLNNKVIGLLDDGFGGTVADSFERLEELIKEKAPGITVKHWKKPNLSVPTPANLFGEIMESTDGVVVGVCA